jgi:fimbrial isopeptide formation D2 family protein/LPXTG-motif cell wall-anchored protein
MKMRKLFAGIAAAATLLGGMALGATSAQADTATAKFTFTAETEDQLTNANLTAYKIGDYVTHGSGDDTAYSVATNSDNKQAVNSALKTAGYNTKDGQDNLAAALSEGSLDISSNRPWNKTDDDASADSVTRKFAEALASEGKLDSESGMSVKFTDTDVTGPDANGLYSATVDLGPGIYVFIDTVEDGAVTKAVPMIVASGTVNDNQLTELTTGATVNMKNSKSEDKTKTVDKASAAIGDTLTYTLTGKIANPAPSAFKFTDTPGTGLTIKAGTFKFFADGTAVSAADFTVPSADVTGNGTATFDVVVNDPAKYAGKTIKVTFNAVVNDEADVEDGVVNELDNYGTPVQVTTSFVGFDFTKINADDQGIKGAEFQVLDGNTTLYFVKQNDGSYKKAASNTTAKATNTLISAADGTVKVTGLDATKIYTVKETRVANGPFLNLKPSFTVTFADGQAVLAKTTASDPYDLVNATNKTVLNVKSVTQLPLTGAAGTALFAVVALLLAGAGATVVLKARSKNAMA